MERCDLGRRAVLRGGLGLGVALAMGGASGVARGGAMRGTVGRGGRVPVMYYDLRAMGSLRRGYVPGTVGGYGQRVGVLFGDGGNTLVYAGDDATLVVDSKIAPFGALVREDARRFAGGTITLLNTHHHADHTGGNEAFAGCEIIAHEKAMPRIASQLDRYKEGAVGGAQAARNIENESKRAQATATAEAFVAKADALAAKDFTPTRTLGDGTSGLEVGGRKIVVHHFGAGHTDNDLVVHLPEENVVHTGDLVFNGLHPFFDGPGGATSEGWIRSLRKAAELCDAETVVVPGHGEITDRAGIDSMATYFEQVRDAVRGAIAAGKTEEEIRQIRVPAFEGRGFEQFAGRLLDWVRAEMVGG
ncbi:MAG: MBL fold metallo-hydrolase [Phycisphaerales bacterium]|jgi:glyoxylase-like metal-dependent hydrolase (beta-lactamase superfamily II)|nr:MBL fold metallo-hydrolase [Phycisphaerales bacterium]